MERFWEFAKLVAVLVTIIVGLLLILLSLPGSRLRQVLLQVFAGLFYAVTGLAVLYIINPIDLLPDFIPLLGQVDDGAALIMAIFAGISGTIFFIQGRKPVGGHTEPPQQLE